MNSKLKIKNLKLVFCIAISVIAAPLTVAAQDITFLPSIAVRGEYDDNLFYTRSIELSDYLIRIKPAFILDYATELLDIESSFDIDIIRYAQETDLDTVNQHYYIDAEYQMMERISVSGNCSYEKDTTLDAELLETGLPGVPDGTRHPRDRYIGGIGFSYMVSEISNVGINYNHNKTKYDWEGNVDYDVDSITLSFNSRFNNQLDIFTVQPSFYRYDSERSAVDNYSLSFGLQHPFNETLILTAFAGARYTKTEYGYFYEGLIWDPSVPGFVLDLIYAEGTNSNFAGVANINLEKTGELYSASIGYNHDLGYSSYGEPLQLYKIRCSADRRLTERFSVNFSGGLYFTESEGNLTDRDNRHFVVTPSMNYRIAEDYSLALTYQYSQANDKARANNPRADRNRVWLELRFRFPEKLG